MIFVRLIVMYSGMQVTTKRVLINYAQRHVKLGANPQVLQPPLQGEVPPTGGGGVNRVSELGRCMCVL